LLSLEKASDAPILVKDLLIFAFCSRIVDER